MTESAEVTGRDEMLTADDVAKRLKITAKQVYALAKTGEMPSFKVGRYVRFCWSDIVAGLKKQKG